MAQANVGIQIAGKRVDLAGEIPDETAHLIIQQVTNLLALPPATNASVPPPA